MSTDASVDTDLGLDVHGGLHIFLTYEDRRIIAKWSGESGVDPRRDVEEAIRSLRRRVGYLNAWLIAYRRQEGEVMEQAR